MIWLTWRQFRVQAYVTGAALAVFAAILAVTGLRLAHLYDTSGILGCRTGCAQLASNFMTSLTGTVYHTLLYLGAGAVYAVPALIGVFWGAPLVSREIETGTLRLAWTQSVSRARWAGVKLGLLGLAAAATAGLVSLLVTWWAEPVDRAAGIAAGRTGSGGVNQFSPVLFGARDVVPVGYAVFAFALGTVAGVLIRRTVPAMAAALAGFVAAQVAMLTWIRPHLLTPLISTTPLDAASIGGLQFDGHGHMTVFPGVNLPGDWVLSSRAVTSAGQVFNGPTPKGCQTGSFQACQAALARLNLRQVTFYQPASRYWDFQWMEVGIFLGLALALAGFCFWWLGRRPA